jgi:hypothetical protein
MSLMKGAMYRSWGVGYRGIYVYKDETGSVSKA